jgi:mannosyltransferase
LLRFARLGSQSLWIDEVFTWQSAGVGTSLGVADLLENVHGPLFALIEHVWCAIAGGSEAALRAPSALCGVATVPAIAWLADRWLGRATAGWAAWLAACSPFMVWYSQEARPYAMLMLLVCVSGALMLQATRRGGVLAASRYAGAAFAGLWSATAFAFALPLHASWWLGPALERARRLRWAAILVTLAAVLSLPWLPSALSTFDWHRLDPGRRGEAGEVALRGRTTFHLAAIPYALHVFAVGYSLGPSPRELRSDAGVATLRRHAPGIAVTALVFGALGALGLTALRRRGRLLEAAVGVLIPFAVVSWFALANFKVFHPRYLAVCVPMLLIALAAAFTDLPKRWRAVFASAVAGLWTLSLTHHYFDPRDRKEDMRGAVASVAANLAADEKVLAVNCRDELEYYRPGAAPIESFWLGYAADSLKLEVRLNDAMKGAGGVWVIESRPEDLDPSGRFAARMNARYPRAAPSAFIGVRVWHVRLAS